MARSTCRTEAADAFALGEEKEDAILMARARIVQCMVQNAKIEAASKTTRAGRRRLLSITSAMRSGSRTAAEPAAAGARMAWPDAVERGRASTSARERRVLQVAGDAPHNSFCRGRSEPWSLRQSAAREAAAGSKTHRRERRLATARRMPSCSTRPPLGVAR